MTSSFPNLHDAAQKNEEMIPEEIQNLSWLKVGKSFKTGKEKDEKEEKKISNEEFINKLSAVDFFTDSEDEKRKRKKRHQKSRKKKERKMNKKLKMLNEILTHENYDLNILQRENVLERIKGIDFSNREVATLEMAKLIENAETPLEKEKDFKKIILDKNLPPICMNRIRIQDNYTYGSLPIQDIPAFHRINFK
jgi:hypothetical protein